MAVAVEGCTGWRYVVEEITAAGFEAHLAEPADTQAARGRKRHAKTDRSDARMLRELLQPGDLRESWIPPTDVLEWRERVRLYKSLVDPDAVTGSVASSSSVMPTTDLSTTSTTSTTSTAHDVATSVVASIPETTIAIPSDVADLSPPEPPRTRGLVALAPEVRCDDLLCRLGHSAEQQLGEHVEVVPTRK